MTTFCVSREDCLCCWVASRFLFGLGFGFGLSLLGGILVLGLLLGLSPLVLGWLLGSCVGSACVVR